MALALSFELRIEERGPGRVVVSVLLAPEGDAVRLDGVALQLVGRSGETLSVQMVLPIAGELRHAMLSTVELRASGELQPGTRVVGTAWFGADQRETAIPTDPFTELEVHMRARRRIPLRANEGEDLEQLLPEERAVLIQDFPWLDEPRMPKSTAELGVVESDEGEDKLDDLVQNLGLDDESAEWLRELLDEDDAAQG